MRRRTSGSHHSRSTPPGRSSPRTRRSRVSSAASRSSTASRLEAVAGGDVAGRERPVRAGVAEQDAVERVVDRLEEALGQAARRHHAEGVPVAARRPRRRSTRVGSADASRGSARRSRTRVSAKPASSSPVAEVADPAQEVVELVRVPRHGPERALDVGERAGVDEVAELLLAEQLAEELAVERQRLRAALGGGRVVRVHVRRDVVEEERGGHRRGGRRLDLDEVELPRLRARAGCPRSAGRSKTSCRHSR